MATLYGICRTDIVAEGVDAILEAICDDAAIFTDLEVAQIYAESDMENCNLDSYLILEFELNTSKTKEVVKQHTVTFKTRNASTLLD